MTRVRAPGSSANLGPGFDVLGLAVARYVWAWDTEDPGRPGADRGNPCGPDHIARIAFEQAGGTGPLYFDFELEPSRGLGFSAAARAAGALLGALQQGHDLAAAQQVAYDVVADIEGHGDNAAPAVFGGAHVIADGYRHRIGSSFPGHLLFWVPEVETLTDESRACLSPTVDRSEAIFNLGCIALLMAAVYEDRVDLLRQATQDRLHQPQRFASCELAAKAYTTALEAGAAAAWLSGSGPTVAVVVEADQIEPMTRVLSESGAVLALDVDEEGAVPVD